MNAQFDEELIHLAQISSVPMRIQQSRARHWVSNIHSDDLVPLSSWDLHDLDILSMGESTESEEAGEAVDGEIV